MSSQTISSPHKIEKIVSSDQNLSSVALAKGGVNHWQLTEKKFYEQWQQNHPAKKPQDFYNLQKLAARSLEGTVERYQAGFKHKPGNFLLKTSQGVVAFLYSTQINLAAHQGKKVKILAAERPNNYFAFPAYFVLEIQ